MGIVDLRKRQARFLPTRTRGFSKRAEKPTPLRQRRARARIAFVFVGLFLIAGAAYGVHAASFHPRISLQAIHVTGASAVSPIEIKRSAWAVLSDDSFHFISRKNLLAYPSAMIEDVIESEFPRIKEVRVSRETMLSQALDIAISERQPYARWCDIDSTCFLMDESGYIFAGSASSTTYTSYVFWGGIATSTTPIGQTVVEQHIREVVTMLELLKEGGYQAVEIVMGQEKDFLVDLSSGYVLKVSYESDPRSLIRNLQLVLGSSALKSKKIALEYIDLRFGNRVYYKMKGDGAVQQAD